MSWYHFDFKGISMALFLLKKYTNGLNIINQSCQKDNIARRRQPYVNSNNI